MARQDVRVDWPVDGRFPIHVPMRSFDLDKEEAGELAQQLLSRLGCSFEIRWPHLEKTRDEKAAARQAELRRRRAGAEDYARSKGMLPSDQYYNEIVEAYIAGHDASPKPLTHPYR